MSNVFKKKKHSTFSWETMGDLKQVRKELGEDMPVRVYRLMQYTLLDVLTKEFGETRANGYFKEAGYLAGKNFAEHELDLRTDLNKFFSNLQRSLQELKIGILRMESFDPTTGTITLTVGEDLDCSGLPITDELVCTYDEGFIEGILEAYTGNKYDVKEIDCWASGERLCRFKGTVVGS